MARLVLAATLSGNYGIYGPPFEHGWSAPREPGSEEYLNSEKYQIHHHDLDRPDSLQGLHRPRESRSAARARRSRMRGALEFHDVENEQMICYSRTAPDQSDIVLVVVNLDPQLLGSPAGSSCRSSDWTCPATGRIRCTTC